MQSNRICRLGENLGTFEHQVLGKGLKVSWMALGFILEDKVNQISKLFLYLSGFFELCSSYTDGEQAEHKIVKHKSKRLPESQTLFFYGKLVCQKSMYILPAVTISKIFWDSGKAAAAGVLTEPV